MKTKKWIAYGVTGIVGLGLIAGGATAAAAAMDLRDPEGTTLPGGQLTGTSTPTLDGSTPVTVDVTNDTAKVVTAVTPTPSPVTPPSATTPVTTPTPVTQATPPSPLTPPSPVTPATPATPASAASASSN